MHFCKKYHFISFIQTAKSVILLIITIDKLKRIKEEKESIAIDLPKYIIFISLFDLLLGLNTMVFNINYLIEHKIEKWVCLIGSPLSYFSYLGQAFFTPLVAIYFWSLFTAGRNVVLW